MNAPALSVDWLLGSSAGMTVGLPGLLAGWFRAMATSRPSPETTLTPSTAVAFEAATGDHDRRDVEAALQGDGEAYGRLVGRYQQPIATYMWRFTRDHLRWEELVQEVFVEAYFSLGTYRAEAPLLHWLRRIATRVGYRQWKEAQRRRRQTALSPELVQQLTQTDPQQADVEEAAALVHALLAQMSPRDRLVLTLLHLEECGVAEAARLTGWSRSMVKVQAYRARKRLQRLLVSKENKS